MADRDRGVTRLEHVEQLLAEAEQVLGTVREAITDRRRRLVGNERELLRRQLAGVVGSLETVRYWLAAGAPR